MVQEGGREREESESTPNAIHTFRSLGVQALSASSSALPAPCMRPERAPLAESRNELRGRRLATLLPPAHSPNPSLSGVLKWPVCLWVFWPRHLKRVAVAGVDLQCGAHTAGDTAVRERSALWGGCSPDCSRVWICERNFFYNNKNNKNLIYFFQMPPSLHAQLSPTSRSYQGILRRLIPTSHGLQYLQNQVKKQTNK